MKTYTYRRILGFTLLILVLAGVAPLLTTVVRAQSVAQITGYPSYVYPGSVVTVTITAYQPGLYTLYLANSSNTTSYTVWASQSINVPTPGNYNISLQLPKSLPNLNTTPTLWILLYLGPTLQDNKSAYIYPLIEVSPPATTIVTFNGTFNNVTVYGYGFNPGSSVSAVVFISVNYSGYIKTYNLTNSTTAGSDGSFSIPVSFSTSFYIAGGLYNVNVTSNATYAANTKLGSLRIDPQAVITNGTYNGSVYGNGRCDSIVCELDSIYVYGYGFAPNSSIVNIQLVNRNYTGVNYNFTPPGNLTTNSDGYFNSSSLSSYFKTNMSAGDYYLVVYQGQAQYSFLNQYYLVRPLLVILQPVKAPGPYKPGQSLTIAVYGYGPSSPWPVAVAVNNITILLDNTVLNASVPLGKDGNATIVNVVLPSVISFGVHYLKGRDSWGYEYTEAIIIGVVAYWIKLTGDKTSPLVSAGYGNRSLVVCPCSETYIGLKFCKQCAVYTGVCDYLGDNISVIAVGLVPGETVTIYFGGIVVGTAVADSNGVAISPPITIPTVPAGVYQLSIYGSVSGYKTVDYFYNTTAYLPGVYPQVYPKIVLTDLNIVNISPIIVGSGIVRVIGTGFTPGISIVGVLANDTDAISSVNTHVSRWTADSNGVLTASYPGVGVITPALWIPVIEPGAYAIKLIFF
ncbi:MAG: hypothetical protein QXE68_04435, partial [Sulfolobales archaeon]